MCLFKKDFFYIKMYINNIKVMVFGGTKLYWSSSFILHCNRSKTRGQCNRNKLDDPSPHSLHAPDFALKLVLLILDYNEHCIIQNSHNGQTYFHKPVYSTQKYSPHGCHKPITTKIEFRGEWCILRALEALGVLMLSCAIWVLFLSILIQNWNKNIVD